MRAQRQSWAHPLMVLYVAPNDFDVTRVGISTTKRLGKAVVRNRVKRLIREAARGFLPAMPGGRDLVFAARSSSAEATYQQVRTAVENLLGRARLIPRPTAAPRGQSGQGKNEMGSASAD